jgi:hypothetical protein
MTRWARKRVPRASCVLPLLKVGSPEQQLKPPCHVVTSRLRRRVASLGSTPSPFSRHASLRLLPRSLSHKLAALLAGQSSLGPSLFSPISVCFQRRLLYPRRPPFLLSDDNPPCRRSSARSPSRRSRHSLSTLLEDSPSTLFDGDLPFGLSSTLLSHLPPRTTQ